MPRLDVFRSAQATDSFYLVDVQAELLSHLRTRVVVPLVPLPDAPGLMQDVNPVFDIMGTPHAFLAQAIASVPAAELRGRVASLSDRHDLVTRALDMLIVGF